MKLKGLIFETSEEVDPKVNPVEILEEIINAVLLRDDTLEQETDLLREEYRYKVLIKYANNKNFYIYFEFASKELWIDIEPQDFRVPSIYKKIIFKTDEEAVSLAVEYITEEIEKIKTTSIRKQENIDFYQEFENVFEDILYDSGFNVSDNVSAKQSRNFKTYRIPVDSENNIDSMLNNYTLLVRLSPSDELLTLSLHDVYDQNEAEVLEHFSSGQFDMKLILKNAVTKLNKALTETIND